MNKNIKAACPKSISWVEVRDNWYPSYKRYNKLWVMSLLLTIPHYNGKKHAVRLIFWGADNFSLAKEVETDNFDDTIKAYRSLRRLLQKIKKMNTLNLKDFLYHEGFEPW